MRHIEKHYFCVMRLIKLQGHSHIATNYVCNFSYSCGADNWYTVLYTVHLRQSNIFYQAVCANFYAVTIMLKLLPLVNHWQDSLPSRVHLPSFLWITTYSILYHPAPNKNYMYRRTIPGLCSRPTTLCLKKTTMTLYTITSMHINRFW